MDYQKIYKNLMEKAVERKVVLGYKETHHITPRSLGGTNAPDNLVELTAREHLIAHMLLAKFAGPKMIHAAYLMSTRIKSSREYATLREQYCAVISNNSDRVAKISASLKGKPKTKEAVANLVTARKANGSYACPDHKRELQKITSAGAGNNMWGKTHTTEARKIISDANKQQVTCNHCNKTGAIAIMQRWHFDNCKSAPNAKERKKYLTSTCQHCGKVGGGAQMIANHFDNCKLRKYNE